MNSEIRNGVIAGVIVLIIGAVGTWLANTVSNGGLIRLLGGTTKEDVDKAIAANNPAIMTKLDALATNSVSRQDVLKMITDNIHQNGLGATSPIQNSKEPQNDTDNCPIVGTWLCQGGDICGNGATLLVSPRSTGFDIDVAGKTVAAYWLSHNRLEIPAWNKNEGDLSSDCKRIDWLQHNITWIFQKR